MKKKKGFTLIELIAVVAILAVLAAVAVPRVISYVEKSKITALKTTCKILNDATLSAYNDGYLDNLIKKTRPQVENEASMSNDEVLNYVNLNEIVNLLYEKGLLKGNEKNTRNVIKNLSVFGYVDLIIKAPENMIKVDSNGGLTQESANEIYEKYWK